MPEIYQEKMKLVFTRLNSNWNAEPNNPNPQAVWLGKDLRLQFYMNPFQFPQFKKGDIGIITFADCARYRFGEINDEGWYRGQCRFSQVIPWGEFYEVSGNLKLDEIPDDWITRTKDQFKRRHFLFYFRDNEFECDTMDWKLEIQKGVRLHF
ncbi:MAG: hypothetical protein LBK60_02045 [Verrucomicrobiales bacterium]|jgi:hypothetical protein|nr:hypothetical protein [Verrucomicrobiales bacterium]